MHATPPLALITVLATFWALACEPAGPGDPGTPPPSTAYDVPFRSDAELSSELASLCRTASDTGRPLLVEFSAAWCSDCRRLHEMKHAPSLADELARWPAIVVNVGRFDRHRPLLAKLGVESIAHWEVMAPARCGEPIEAWPTVARRTLEVSSGAARDLTPRDLAGWLAAVRTGARR